MTPRRRVDEGIRHGEPPAERDVSRLERQGLVNRRDRRPAQGGNRLERALLGKIPPDHLVHLVDLDRTDEQRFPTSRQGAKRSARGPPARYLRFSKPPTSARFSSGETYSSTLSLRSISFL